MSLGPRGRLRRDIKSCLEEAETETRVIRFGQGETTFGHLDRGDHVSDQHDV